MRKKIFLGLASFLVLLLAALILVPLLYKDRIAGMIKDEANKNLNAKLEFSDVSLSLIRSFPNLNLGVSGLSITGKGDFEEDTLIHAGDLSITLDLMSVIRGGTVEVRGVSLDKALLNFIVLNDGRANWDIAIPDSTPSTGEQAASPFKAALKSFRISDSRISYHDQEMGMKLQLAGLNTEGNGDFTEKKFTLSTNSQIAESNLWYGGVHYLNRVNASLRADLDMDMERMRFTFLDNELQLNTLVLGMNGWVEMPNESIQMDLAFALKKTDFSALMSLVPGLYTEQFGEAKGSGKIALDLNLKGVYDSLSMPGFKLALVVDRGQFRYPSLPTGINNVNINLLVENPDGVPDHTRIDLKKFHVELGAEPFDARLSVRTPVSDAAVDGEIKGAVNLDNIRSLVPLEKGTSISGRLSSNLQFKGRVSALNNKQYDSFAASGALELNQIRYSTAADPVPTEITVCKLSFNPQRVSLDAFSFRKGVNSLSANGHLDNLIQHLINDTTLIGQLSVSGPQIDLDALGMTSADSSSTTDTSAMSLIEVPDWIDFTVNARIGLLKMGDIKASAMQGSLQVAKQSIQLRDMDCDLIGGHLRVNGSYATTSPRKANVDFSIAVSDADITQTVNTFPSTGKMAAIMKQASGRYSATMNYTSVLDEHMSPDLNTMSGYGKLSTKGVTIRNFKPLVKVAEATKLEQFKALPVSDVNISFSFSDGKISTEPFKVNLGGIPCTVSGSSSFDQRIDYTVLMELPSSGLPGGTNQAITSLLNKANASGANLSLGKSIPLQVGIGGTVSDPVIKTDLKSLASAATNKLKDDAKALIEQQKKALEDQAKAEADKLKKEAEDRAKKEADKLKKEAEEKARLEKERLKKEAEKQAKDALNGLFKKK
ncbi:MAG: AsmA-like C-terminal region-containing protein [Bacteroidota bacterium]